MKILFFALSVVACLNTSAQILEFRAGAQYTKFFNTDSYYVDCYAQLSPSYYLDYIMKAGAKQNNLTLQVGFQTYNGWQRKSSGGLGSNFYYVDTFAKGVLSVAALPIQKNWTNGLYTKAGLGLDLLIFSKVHGHSGGWSMNGPSIPTVYYNEQVRQISKPIAPVLIGEFGKTFQIGQQAALNLGYHFSFSLSKEMMFSYALKNMLLLGFRYDLK